MFELFFWIILGIIFYTYFGYPLLILFFSLFINNKINKKDIEPKVTFLISAYNEEKNIRRCLESVKWADEIIVVDSKSTDHTVQICREYTDKIILRDFPGHIEQKNFAIDQAADNWVFCLDADEEATPELQDEIKSVLEGEDTDERDLQVAAIGRAEEEPSFRLSCGEIGRGRGPCS